MSEGSRFIIDETAFERLEQKVVILTGGASGIGTAIVQQLDRHGAFVVFGDINDDRGKSLESTTSDRSTFVHMDVAKYDDNIKLFDTAYTKHGRVDHAIACAGILEQGKWFDSELTIETVKTPESNVAIDVNLLGVLYFARIAVVYLKEAKSKEEDKSLTLISSAAGFRESALPVYQCSKHGVMGLLRTLRGKIYPRDGIRINAICPTYTETGMTAPLQEEMRRLGKVSNSPDDVAKYVLGLEVSTDRNGQSIYVEGGRGWEFEEGLERTMPLWLGKEAVERMEEDKKIMQGRKPRTSYT